GCLVDQLLGQHLAEVGGLGPLLAPANIRKTLESIWRYNHKPNVAQHDSVQRTYVLNDEAAILVCDYGKGTRPRIPFPYYAEAWTPRLADARRSAPSGQQDRAGVRSPPAHVASRWRLWKARCRCGSLNSPGRRQSGA